MKFKLVAVDLDGTLLNSDHQIPPAHLHALKTIYDQGTTVILATGKTAYSADNVYKQLGFRTPGVFSQGLSIYAQDGSLSYESTLPNDASREIVQLCVSDNIDFVEYKWKEILSLHQSPMDQILVNYHEPKAQHMGTVDNLFQQLPFQKILIYGDSSTLRAQRPTFQKRFGDKCGLVFGNPVMLEFVPKGSSKGDGVRRLLEQLGTTHKEMIAFGDGENDLEMIQSAGLGIAMENAVPELKAVADFVTKTNDEAGIAYALIHFGLI